MNLIKHKNELVQERKFPGLINVKFTHEIKSSKATFDYLGPKIQPEVWQAVLAFFKWTNDTTHSESQVRLFVNPALGRWAAWAYPQRAQMGMSAHELSHEEIKREFKREVIETEEMAKERFGYWQAPPSADWIYVGTAHHHCGCTAFQSGVDETNEQNQEGLHITVGSMHSQHYDLHCRFYLNGACFEPDMSLLWDVGGEAKRMFPAKLWNEIARYQMCEPDPQATFPETWRANIIEVKPSYSMGHTQGAIGFRGGGTANYSDVAPYGTTDSVRAFQAAKAILEDVAESPWTLEQLNTVMDFLKEDAICDILWTNMTFYRIDFQDLVNGWPDKKPAKKIFNKALRRMNHELQGGPLVDRENDEDPNTESGSQPGGEMGGSPPVDPNMYGVD